MSENPDGEKATAAPAKGDLNHSLFFALMANTVIVNFVVSLVRVTTSYRAIELNLSVFWISVIAAGFSLVPVFAAVWLGRFIDRGHDALSAWIGAGLMLIACAGFWWHPSSDINLLMLSIMLGFGHMFCMAGHQMISVRSAGPISRESVFGYHMIAIALGQGLGPMLLGWLGGGAHIPPTGVLFEIALGGAIVSQIVAFTLRPAIREPAQHRPTDRLTVRELLGNRALTAVLLASVVTVVAFELLIVYLPLLGSERQIDTRDIGLLLATRTAVSICARIFYARLIIAFGRTRLILVGMLMGAAGFTLIGLPVSLPFMYLAVVIMGMGLGVSTVLTFSSVVMIAPPNARATALSLRLTGNRIGQMIVPVLAGITAEATGIGGVLVIIAGFLAASGIFTHAVVRLPWPGGHKFS
jgi:MFS family permease